VSDLNAIKQIDLAGFLGRHYGVHVASNGAALCPFHDDHEPSLSVSQKNGVWLFKCHACGAAGTILDFVMRKEELQLADAVRRIRKLETIRDESAKEKPEIVRVHSYTDENSIEVYQKIKRSDGNFLCRRKEGDTWIYNLQNVAQVPYRLDKIKDEPDVTICEGERDADTLAALGYPATSAPNGKDSWPDEITPIFAGKVIRIIYDVGNDAAALKVARKLSAVCEHIFILKVPLPEHEADITDYLGQFATDDEKRDAFLGIEAKEEKFEPDTLEPPETPDELESCMFQIHIPALLGWIERARSGKFLGFEIKSLPKLNKVLSGIRETSVLAAVPKIGKTTLLSQISHDLSDQGVGVLYYEYEIGRLPLMVRDICRRYRISYWGELLNANYSQEDIVARLGDLSNVNKHFAIITDRGLTVEKIQSHILEMRRRTGQAKVFLAIDSLQKMPIADLRDRRAGIDGWLRNFEMLKAEDPDLAIMAISELSREGKLKESGDIEYSAHFVLKLEPLLDEDEIKKFGDDGRRNLWVLYARDVGCPNSPILLQGHFEYWEFTEESP
jgi:hypothetical protein